MRYSVIVIVCCLLFGTCSEEPVPKPKAFLRLDYPTTAYQKMTSDCKYSFEIPQNVIVVPKKNCWLELQYPKLKASVHITYRDVNNNLSEILKEIEKMTLEHTIKADAISSKQFDNFNKNVFGTIYNVEGNSASNLQFRATDSTKNVLSGALYFYVKPNYDSLVPAIKYIEKDVKKLLETLEWKE